VAESSPRIPEATIRAIVMGIVFGSLFGAANAYLGLRVGMTVATSIPIAVMTVATLRVTGARASILEANLSQTIGSASTSLATGAIFTLPALWMWGDPPSYLQIVGLSLCGGIIGVSAMIPLRRMLIVKADAELPYPEGRACAEVLRATTGEGAPGAWIFYGLLLGAAFKLALGLAHLVHSELALDLPGVANMRISLEVAPALIGVGYILGARYASVCMAGGVIAALALAPLITTLLTQPGAAPPPLGTVTKSYVRYIGVGAVACAAIVTVIRMLPAMTSQIVAVVRGLRARGAGGDGGVLRAGEPSPQGSRVLRAGEPSPQGTGVRADADTGRSDPARVPPATATTATVDRTDLDVPRWVIATAITLVVLAIIFVPGLLGGNFDLGQRAVIGLCIALFGMIFVTVAARIVGLIGVTSQPTSGMMLMTLLAIGGIVVALGWGSPEARFVLLTAATVVATAASKAGDISQDLKTGYLVGATPRTQQLGQYLGAATACWAVAATILFIGATAKFGVDPAAPQATLAKTVIDGQLEGNLPWDLVLAGAGIAAAAMLAQVQGLAFAIGVYLPFATLSPIFLGGLIRRVVDGPTAGKESGAGAGILAASGMVAGEGLAGVVIAALRGGADVQVPKEPLIGGDLGTAVGILLVAAACWLLVAAGRSDRKRRAAAPVSV
jgi:OPT family oligopeptide transporter